MANTFLYGSSSPKAIVYNGNSVKRIIYNGTVVWQSYSLDTGVFVLPDQSTGLFRKLSGNMGAPACTMHIRAVGWKSSIDVDVPVSQGDKVTVSLHSPITWGGWNNNSSSFGWTGYEILITVGTKKYYTYYGTSEEYDGYGPHHTYSYKSEYEIPDSSGRVTTGTPAAWSAFPNGQQDFSTHPATPIVLISIGAPSSQYMTRDTRTNKVGTRGTVADFPHGGIVSFGAIGTTKSIGATALLGANDPMTLKFENMSNGGSGDEIEIRAGKTVYYLRWTNGNVTGVYETEESLYGRVVKSGNISTKATNRGNLQAFFDVYD